VEAPIGAFPHMQQRTAELTMSNASASMHQHLCIAFVFHCECIVPSALMSSMSTLQGRCRHVMGLRVLESTDAGDH
jgi:hypothetical protein